MLNTPPDQITLRQAIEGIEGKPVKLESLLNGHAPVHIENKWGEICDLADNLLDETTLAQLTGESTGDDHKFEHSLTNS